MDLTNPLRSLTPSLESAVLAVLAGTESALNASQIARLSSRGTRNGQAPVLARLVEHGLVLADPAPIGSLYRFNRDHVLAPAILAATNARTATVDRLRDAITDLASPPVHSSIFGSFARGEGDPTSDIDLLLVVEDDVSPHSDAWTDQLSELGDRVGAWTGNRLEPLTLTTTRLAAVVADAEAIVDEWLRDSLDLTGLPLRSLPPLADR